MRLRRLVPSFVLLWAAAGVSRGGEKPAFDFDPPVRLKAGDELIDTVKYVGHAGPLTTDLDADGKPDLLVGNFAGHFQVYMNTGTRAEPLYAAKGLLEAGGETAKVPNW